MIVTLIASTLFSLNVANAQSQTPTKGGPPPVVAPSPADASGKPPGMLPVPPVPTDTKFTGKECDEEAKKTSCKGGAINVELLQCMMKYRKDHHEFSVSPTCREAIRKWHMTTKPGAGK